MATGEFEAGHVHYPGTQTKELQLTNAEGLKGFQDCRRECFMLFSIVLVPLSGNLSQPQTMDTASLFNGWIYFNLKPQDADPFKECC